MTSAKLALLPAYASICILDLYPDKINKMLNIFGRLSQLKHCEDTNLFLNLYAYKCNKIYINIRCSFQLINYSLHQQNDTNNETNLYRIFSVIWVSSEWAQSQKVIRQFINLFLLDSSFSIWENKILIGFSAQVHWIRIAEIIIFSHDIDQTSVHQQSYSSIIWLTVYHTEIIGPQ